MTPDTGYEDSPGRMAAALLSDSGSKSQIGKSHFDLAYKCVDIWILRASFTWITRGHVPNT